MSLNSGGKHLNKIFPLPNKEQEIQEILDAFLRNTMWTTSDESQLIPFSWHIKMNRYR